MTKKYQVIYSDPPWKYGSKGARGGKFGELPYPSMTIKQMCAMSVPASIEINEIYPGGKPKRIK